MAEREPVRVFPVERHGVGRGAPELILDELAVEEPLELRIGGAPQMVTMRTPGEDLDLCAGWLASEGIIDGWDDVSAMAHVDDPRVPRGNTVDVLLASGFQRGLPPGRNRYASSACGICSLTSLDQICTLAPPLLPAVPIPETVLYGLPERLRAAQVVFARTGGLHAAALFDVRGELVLVREDIGRHNAVDKCIGAHLRREGCFEGLGLLVSARAGLEIVQKARMLGISLVVCLGAPSSLAVELAKKSGLELIGFLNARRLNRYAPIGTLPLATRRGAPEESAP